MPAQKRSQENSPEDLPDSNDEANQEQLQQEMEASDRSPSNDGSEVEKEENFIMVKLSEVRKEVQCPICLGIIRKTRTVMECLHRFCRECIDKSMRLGNKECPACRKHCASRRSLRDDPNYDALIAALYPDIDRYEEEELAFHDEENARNKQIQASIKQTFERQSEALSKKRKRPRSATRRRSIPHSADEDIANNVSSPDESPETRIKRLRRFSRSEQVSPVKAIEEEGGSEEHDDVEANKETGILYNGGLVAGTSEMLAWGKGGTRSHTRSGNGNTKYARTNRLARLVDHLRNLEENNELDIHIVFVCLEGEKTPALPQSHLCCRPAFSVRQLCEFISGQTSLEASEVEILLVKEVQSKIKNLTTTVDVHHVPNNTGSIIEACKDELQLLDGEQTIGGVKDAYNFTQGHMLLAYRQKSVRRVVRSEPS